LPLRRPGTARYRMNVFPIGQDDWFVLWMGLACRHGPHENAGMSRIEQAFADEWEMARAARRAGAFDRAFHHLERAHILGQRRTWLHILSHLGMLQLGWQRKDVREMVGQVSRVLAAALFSRVWVPAGNTGGARV